MSKPLLPPESREEFCLRERQEKPWVLRLRIEALEKRVGKLEQLLKGRKPLK